MTLPRSSQDWIAGIAGDGIVTIGDPRLKRPTAPVEDLQEAGPERRRYIITEDGVADVEKWLGEPVPPDPDLQSELFTKVVLALMLGKRADSYLDTQRAAHLQRMRELTSFKQLVQPRHPGRSRPAGLDCSRSPRLERDGIHDLAKKPGLPAPTSW